MLNRLVGECLRRRDSLAHRELRKRAGIDLFAGAGGLSFGFAAAGFNMAVAIDRDVVATRTILANSINSPSIVVRRDIRKFGPRAMESRLRALGRDYKVDLIVAGPPCQGWSKVGRGKLQSLGRLERDQSPFKDPRNRLFRSFLRYVAFFRPSACVMENVLGMATFHGEDVSKAVAAQIASLGYDVTLSRIDATNLGVPQRRNRLIFVAFREDLGVPYSIPSAPPEDLNLVGDLGVVRDAIRDLPRIPDGYRRERIPYRPRKPLSGYARLLRPSWMNRTVDAHVTRWHSSEDLHAFRAMPQGGMYRDIPGRFRRYRSDIFPDKYRRLSWDKPSPCLTAHLSKDGYSHIHPSQARTISVREAARLQGFPDWYRLEGNMGERYRLLGNAVSPIVGYTIAVSVREALGGKSIGSWHDFAWRRGKEVVGAYA